MTTVLRLPPSFYPWRFALHIDSVDTDTFHRFIDALKHEIQPSARKWSAVDRCWMLRDSEKCIALLKRFRIDYDLDQYAESEAEPEPEHRKLSNAAAYETFYLLPTAPDFVVQAVYKALVKKYHPDAGGDTATMQKINAAMEVLR